MNELSMNEETGVNYGLQFSQGRTRKAKVNGFLLGFITANILNTIGWLILFN